MRAISRVLVLILGCMTFIGVAFGKSSSSVTVTSSSNPSTYGNSVTFTATVTPSAATRTVTFKDGSTTLGTGTLSSGKTTFSTSTLAAGSHSITAAYGGDSNYNSSTSSVLTQTVNKANTTVTVASSANPSTYGSSVTFTVTISPSAATGTMTFKDGTTTLGTGTISSGKATFSTSTLAAGSHSITAAYGGSANYNTSTSAVLTQTINKANTTVALASSKNPSTYGSTVTFTATISPSSATGTVTFKDGTTTLGTGTISSGKATYAIATLAAGTHAIAAVYGGNSNYNGSTSSVLTQTVNKANTSTTMASSSNPSAFGSSVTFTATVTPSAATGTVTFKDGSTTLGTGTLSGGTATYSTSTLAIGSHAIKATYGGDSNDNTSTSGTLTQTVKQASSVALTSTPNPSPYGAVLTFIAAVTPSAATGTVAFYDGAAALGTGTISSGTATFATSTLALGSHSITAVYGGNTTYVGSTSPILTQNVLTLTSISVTPQNASLAVGATQQYTATGTFSNQSQGNITSSATWTSSDVTVAKISAVGIATGVAEGPATIEASVGTINGSAALTGTPSRFRLTGSMITVRAFNTATTLQNGQVLIVGGYAGGVNEIGACELFNPATGTFAPTGSLNIPRAWHTATLLQNGQVLIAGGEATYSNGNGYKPTQAELYDPATGLFSYTGNLNLGRFGDTATLLQNGMVLIAGGDFSTGKTAELYDPVAGTFAYTGSLNTPLWDHSATLLNDGTVLIAGGDNIQPSYTSPIVGTEIYNPAAGTFTPTGNLNIARENHTATLLASGKVLIAAGSGSQANLASAEIYDPVAKVFTLTGNLSYARATDTATLLNSGQVLIVGSQTLGVAELYDPTSGTFSLAGNLNIPRGGPTASLLNDGTVLIAGSDVPQAEIYQSAGSPIEPPDSLQITPAVANVMVGGTQHFTAIDNFGYPRQDVTWTVSNPGLASVTTDENDAAVLTGLAAGQVTLTANAETASAQEQVTILAAGSYPPGTIIWSAPPVPGFSALQLVQAVPTGTGPDLYSTQLSSDGTQSVVQALTADGRQLWQAALPKLNNNSVPDGVGGLLVTEYDTCTSGQTMPLTVVDLDPVYGQPLWSVSATGIQVGNQIVYCYGNGDAPQIAVRGDGAVIISGPTNNGFPPLSVMNTPTCCGYYLPIPTSTNTINGNTIYVQCCMGPPMVNSDGWGYVEYEVRNVVNNVITSDSLYLQQIAPTDNNFPTVLLSTTTQNQALLPGPIVPDGQGGILATWTISPSSGPVPQYPYQAADVVAGVVGTPYNLPFSPTTAKFGQSPTIVLGENGTAFGAGPSTATDGTNAAVSQIASFVLSSGTPNWTYQGTAGNTLSLIAATAGNGLVAKITDQSGNDTVLTFNSSGMQGQARRSSSRSSLKPIVEAAISGLSNADYYATNGSWLGLIGNNSVAVLGNFILEASAPATRPRGDAQHNGTTDPGLALVGIQDCHKVSPDKTIVARYPSYSLRLPSNLAQEPPCSTDASQCYTVFEYIPQNQTGCGPAGYNNLNPCQYTNGASPPFNEFDDEITAGNSGAFNKTQYFDYGIPNQRLWGVKQIYSTFSGSPQRKQPNVVFNQLHADPAADPLIDGNLDPWLAPWDGTVASCHSCNSQWFNTCP
jgi:Bacterial Ig-like domain (group 3)/Bacterial Ig-like domain (group 2)